jgi:hypothetical protein
VGHVAHIFGRAHGGGHGRHHADAALVMVSDLLGRAAMQPVAVGQVGKPLLPRASEPWHCAQLFMNRRSPMAMAWGPWPFLRWHAGELGIQRLQVGLGLGHFGLADLRPAQLALKVPRPG